MLTDPRPPKWQAGLERSFSRAFPRLVQEIEGMVQGVKESGYDAASFAGLFGIVQGEVLDYKGCSSIANIGNHATFLAHNEEERSIVPLCYAKVRLRKGQTTREFLSVSYPFQLFGSAVGANADIGFTGNSIGMQRRIWMPVRDSLMRRVPKTVLTRLMLECRSIAAVRATS